MPDALRAALRGTLADDTSGCDRRGWADKEPDELGTAVLTDFAKRERASSGVRRNQKRIMELVQI